jgi:hypothetical protein
LRAAAERLEFGAMSVQRDQKKGLATLRRQLAGQGCVAFVKKSE